MRRVLALLVVATLCAACSSAPTAHRAPSTHTDAQSTPTPKPTHSAYTATVGEDAALIGKHIKGCTGLVAGSIGSGARSGLGSTASCHIDGQVVIIDGWDDPTTARLSDRLLSVATYYACSTDAGWTAILADPGHSPAHTVLQMQLDDDAGGLTQLGFSGTHQATASLSAERTIAGIVARDLSGRVEYGH